MARNKKKQKPDFTKVRFLTGVGEAVYPHLNKPDSYEGGPPKYKVDVIFNDNDGGFSFTTDDEKIGPLTAVEFLAKAEEFYEAEVAAIQEKSSKRLSPLPLPICRIDDTDNDHHGKIRVRVAMRAEIERDGNIVVLKPSFFDAKKKPIKMGDLPNIGGGSRLRVAGNLVGYLTGTSSGMTPYLSAVQVIEPKDFGRSAESYGFGDEDGFDAEESTPRGNRNDEDDDDDEIEMDED